MTREEAIKELKDIRDTSNPKAQEILDNAIKRLELLGHLKDRPCSVCEFHKENGCCKWSCVFDEVLRKD